MLKICLLLGIALACLGQIESTLNPKVLCYYESWYYWREGRVHGKMTTADIDSSLCTDIVYGYMGATLDSYVYVTDPWLMDNLGDLKNFTKNKGNAKALVAFGGYNLTPNLTLAAETPTLRNRFANSIVEFLRKYNFDGISLDWSQNAWRDEEFEKYKELIKTIRAAFSADSFTLIITVPALNGNFHVAEVNPYVDYISVSTYDLHGGWEMAVGYEAPIDWQVQCLNGWYNTGAPMEKLLMSVPFYGHSWLLEDEQQTEPGSAATGPAPAGPYCVADGKLCYNEVCEMAMKGGWKLKSDSEQMSNYMVKGKFWASFEDTKTIEARTKNATTMGFGGVVIQTINNDDFMGNCGEKYPLLKAAKKGLNKDPIVVPTHSTGTTPVYTITPPPTSFCRKEGTFRDTKDCNIYHKCIEFFPGQFNDEIYHCQYQSQAFDETTQKCVDKSLVPGCH